MHASCVQLDRTSRRVREEEEEVTEPAAMLAESEEQDMDDLDSNVSTQHAGDVERDHLRDPEVEWLYFQWKRLRIGCRTSWRFAWCGVHPRPAICNKPRHVVRSDGPAVCQLVLRERKTRRWRALYDKL